jgi:hypothetical protein
MPYRALGYAASFPWQMHCYEALPRSARKELRARVEQCGDHHLKNPAFGKSETPRRVLADNYLLSDRETLIGPMTLLHAG